MSILSFEYLGLAGISSLVLWIFCHASIRKYAVAVCNLAFLFLLHADLTGYIYAAALTLFTWLFGFLLQKKKSLLLLVPGVLLPVAGLCWFKYAGYFTHNSVIMPLGLSFYTFKAVSYIADVYKGRAAGRDPVLVFDYICFFPAFSAGPIHRSEPFFQQLEESFVFDYRDQKNGCIQAGLGLFEKLVLADALSNYVSLFMNKELTGWYTLIGVLLYAFQIYVDFDAYSNTAIGTARMMGIHLERNFHTPYLANDLREFWRRWHMSLSSWLRDYVYIPLGGSRKGLVMKWINTVIVFLVSGIWHGSTLMFVIWGLGHGLISVVEDMFRQLTGTNKALSRALYVPGMILNFLIVSFLWIFFRSGSMEEARMVIQSMLSCFSTPLSSFDCELVGITVTECWWILCMIVMIILTDIMRYFTDMIEFIANCPFIVRWAVYICIMVIAMIFGVYGPGYDPQDFIYVTF
ncbi:MAG: MBOAT family O-acyltransferase [Erysipelotrichaceae bacterium]|nr:MBOAT family O-acyltransferase [Erysipelotrichaceae bacterium]